MRRGRAWAARNALCLAFAIAPLAAAACTLTPLGPDRLVARVLDGETLELSDGARVRLANVMAPLPADTGVDADRLDVGRAGREALDALVTGKSIRLHVDAAPKDRYGVIRAHVRMTGFPEAPPVQVLLARDGHVRAIARVGERACIDMVVEAEGEARAAARGLWTEPAFRVREAQPARDLALLRGTFQIVTGEVHAVERARDMDRLVLGPDRQRSLTISLRSNDRALVEPLGGDLKALVGRRIEARGWISARPGRFAGPDMDVSLAGHVRLVP